LLACALPRGGHAQEGNATTASTTFYVRADTDRTIVYTPRAHVSAPLAEETRLDLVYTVDVWTSASIDIRTSASIQLVESDEVPSQRTVTEQRDEINVGLSQGLADLTLSGGYRYSTEYDYESHGGTLGAAYDLADNNATLALSLSAYFDEVGRAGDPAFARDATQWSARLSFHQVIDASTFAGAIYELIRQDGYLGSPYRYVRFASEPGAMPSTCTYPVRMCLPERNPSERMRHAVAVYARRALGDSVSVGASYRFYLDDWSVSSHTAIADGAWMPSPQWLLRLAYRFYHQSSASHYEPYYLVMPEPRHYTSDKELTALTVHRIGVELERGFDLDERGSALRLILLGGPSLYFYQVFPLLDRITAAEVALTVELAL
jgi:hypothetical protein